MSIETQFAEALPEGWHLSHLILLDPEWQINITDGKKVVVATGTTISEALGNAYTKADIGEYVTTKWNLKPFREPTKQEQHLAGSSLLAALSLHLPTSAPIKRRV